ncbi:tyrosine phosphatase-like protein [Absidia repens]|uniref:Very-long-chain (3R)-3-hydroxyacyl-CoA dehydratase n=1 Tax=Absidia repens TaxID=90262 RepID=A0A1X2I8Z9_9FUNG|nr:tyrosine phosphatase-like protein [Absidia repens]
MDEGHWQGLPTGLQNIVYGVVIYSTLLDLFMSFAVDRLACLQSLIRFFVMFGIAAPFPAVQTLKIFYPCMLVVWSVNNLIAYAFGASQAWFTNPKDISPTLINARYSWFRFLSPISVVLEVLMAYLAMPLAKEWNKTYSLVMILGAFAYIPGFPALFQNKLIERRKYIQRQFLEKNK